MEHTTSSALRVAERGAEIKVPAAEMSELIDSEVFLAYSTYSTIVLLKMLLMGPLTGYFRVTRKAFITAEDATAHGAKDEETTKKYMRTDPYVERVRR
ncbi:hypothetical protein scyTo_0004133 [Scyliorhinus torazame]|uniref:Uncharacterized protein n=1 Tax=Scyliorhinus torazame TaxID=75743 RepID=A0A401NLA7_SCYTO|nr:hypothetical protein [Scyliorhinus torazame]